MRNSKETFGQKIRSKRMEQKITLRKFSEMVKLSPTFMSKVERDEAIPSEENVKLMARTLGEDEAVMLSLANKLPSDIPKIIHRNPSEAVTFLRKVQGYNRQDWLKLLKKIN